MPTLRVAITLHGVTRTFEVPVHIENQASGIVVSGRLGFNQTDFGITPLSVLGGGRFRCRIASICISGLSPLDEKHNVLSKMN